MGRIRSSLLFVALFLLVAACQEDPESAANRLFVEAASLIKEAQSLSEESLDSLKEKRSLIEKAKGNLQNILTQYPSSTLAVEIAASGSAKGISINDLDSDLSSLGTDITCMESPESCFIGSVINEENALQFDPVRRSAVVALLSANGRWEDAITMLDGLSGRQRDKAAEFIFAFGVFYDEPEVASLVSRAIPKEDKETIAGYIKEIDEKAKALKWERSGSPLESPVLKEGSATASPTEPLENLAATIERGKAEEIQSLVSTSFKLARDSHNTGTESTAYQDFDTKLRDELQVFFNKLRD